MTGRTNLSYLDLAEFYQAAKAERDWAVSTLREDSHWRQPIIDVCDKLIGVINALRQDGLDPRWHPEQDACLGAMVRGSFRAGNIDTVDYVVRVEEAGARDIITHLKERGYKIVKAI